MRIVSSFMTSMNVANFDSSGLCHGRQIIMKIENEIWMASWPQRKLPIKTALNTKAILRKKKLRGKTRIHFVDPSLLKLVAWKTAPYLFYTLFSFNVLKFLQEQPRNVAIKTQVKTKNIKDKMFEQFSEQYVVYQFAFKTLRTAERKKSRKVSIKSRIIPFHKK